MNKFERYVVMKALQRLVACCFLVCFLSASWDVLCEEFDQKPSDEFYTLYSDDMTTLLYVENNNGPYGLIVPEGGCTY